MIFERIDRVIRCTNNLDVRHFDQITRFEAACCKLRIHLFPNDRRILLINKLVYAEEAAKLQMRPMVKRVTDGLRNRSCPCLEALIIRNALAARNVLLLNSVCAERPPFVVVAVQPSLRNIREACILVYLLWA
ncbi:hypothetical protein D3C78_653150 [compost metagenome]